MKEEIPSPVPDYNVKPDSKFDPSKYLIEIDGYYSPFWPLTIVFLAFIFLYVYEISYLRYRKLVVTEQLSHYIGLEKKTKDQANFIKSMHDDMAALAPTHPDVAAIMRDYFPDSDAKPAAPPQPTDK